MAIRFGFSALFGLFSAYILSVIQLGEVNLWSLLFGYHVGLLIEIIRSIMVYLQSVGRSMTT